MLSSGVKPKSSAQCPASATRRAAGVGNGRSQTAGLSVTGRGSPPSPSSKVMAYGSREP